MNDLDDQLNRTLREHADGVHGAPLAFDDVRGRATSIRRRRRLASGLGVAAAIAVIVPTALFATPVWLVHDGLSALLPLDHTRRGEILSAYAKHFPGRPLFIVGDTPDLPDGVDPATVEPVLTRRTELPMWDESDTQRPAGAHQVPVDIAVWHVRGT